MTKLKLRVRHISANGAVVLGTLRYKITSPPFLANTIKPGGGKMTSKPAANKVVTKTAENDIHVNGHLIFVPAKDDKNKYAVDQVYEFELKKV